MSSTIDFDNLTTKECKTCGKSCHVFISFKGEVECHNCYITRLEFHELEKKNKRKDAKVLPIRGKQVIPLRR